MTWNKTETVFNEATGQWEIVKDIPEEKPEAELPPVTEPEPVQEPVKEEPAQAKRGRGRPRTGFDRRAYMRTYMLKHRQSKPGTRMCVVSSTSDTSKSTTVL